jgi:hypothetical protein
MNILPKITMDLNQVVSKDYGSCAWSCVAHEEGRAFQNHIGIAKHLLSLVKCQSPLCPSLPQNTARHCVGFRVECDSTVVLKVHPILTGNDRQANKYYKGHRTLC